MRCGPLAGVGRTHGVAVMPMVHWIGLADASSGSMGVVDLVDVAIMGEPVEQRCCHLGVDLTMIGFSIL